MLCRCFGSFFTYLNHSVTHIASTCKLRILFLDIIVDKNMSQRKLYLMVDKVSISLDQNYFNARKWTELGGCQHQDNWILNLNMTREEK